MARKKTTAERGKFKAEISGALYKNKDIRELLLGDTSGKSATEVQMAFKEQVKSHLFIDDTITDAKTFIFYDIRFPYMRANKNVSGYHVCYVSQKYPGDIYERRILWRSR